MIRCSIYIYKERNKLVHVSRNIDDFHNWILDNVRFAKLLDFKKMIEDEKAMMIINRDKVELFRWVNYLSNYLMLSDYEVSINMQL